jgi:hypothetical protein
VVQLASAKLRSVAMRRLMLSMFIALSFVVVDCLVRRTKPEPQ